LKNYVNVPSKSKAKKLFGYAVTSRGSESITLTECKSGSGFMLNNQLFLHLTNKKTQKHFSIVADPDPYVLGLLDPDPLVRGMDPDPDPSIIKQK
jgi:hypothetical protein